MADMRSKGLPVLAALLVVGAAFFLLRPGHAVVIVEDGPTTTIAETGEMVVASMRTSGGLSVLGLHVKAPRYLVEVRFTTEVGCADVVSPGDPWPPGDPTCSTTFPLTGTVAAHGITQSGRSLIGVEFAVSRDCYMSLHAGEAWAGATACA